MTRWRQVIGPQSLIQTKRRLVAAKTLTYWYWHLVGGGGEEGFRHMSLLSFWSREPCGEKTTYYYQLDQIEWFYCFIFGCILFDGVIRINWICNSHINMPCDSVQATFIGWYGFLPAKYWYALWMTMRIFHLTFSPDAGMESGFWIHDWLKLLVQVHSACSSCCR